MPLQNRVQATGDIIAHPARGMFMGNRGILHDTNQRLGTACWRHKAWVTCVLRHKDCCKTECPGRHFPWADFQRRIRAGQPVPAEPIASRR